MKVRRSVLAFLGVFAVLPATASAAEFAGGAIHAAPTKTDRGVSEMIWFKSPRSLPGRTDIRVDVDNLRCAGPAFGAPANSPISIGEVSVFKGVRVASDGTFAATFKLDNTASTGEKSKGRVTLKGKLSGSSARGTVAAFINVSDAQGNPTTRCELSRTRWFAETATRVSNTRLPKPDGRKYFGVSDHRGAASKTKLPVIVNLTRNRKQGTIVVQYNATCTGGDPATKDFAGPDFSLLFPVRNGKFTSTETYDFGDPAGAGFAARITTRYAGAFVSGGAKGTLRVQATLFQDGKPTGGRCDTGRVKWRALLR